MIGQKGRSQGVSAPLFLLQALSVAEAGSSSGPVLPRGLLLPQLLLGDPGSFLPLSFRQWLQLSALNLKDFTLSHFRLLSSVVSCKPVS